MCRYKELVCKEEEDMPPTNTLVDDLSLSDEEDVGLEEGQGFGGGGGDEEEMRKKGQEIPLMEVRLQDQQNQAV